MAAVSKYEKLIPTGSHPSEVAVNGNYVTYAQSINHQPQPRYDIDRFCQDVNRLNLFLLALADMQGNGPDNLKSPWSYWGLASIHGLPDEPWSGVQKDTLYKFLRSEQSGTRIQEGVPFDGSGYCRHGSVTL
jgi:hypothetical protein